MTTEPYYQDETVTLLHGDALKQARTLPDASVDCIVTSPPYYGLRNYGSPYQYGLEETPALYVETMRKLFAECRRALADDGTFWLNLGDSYYSGRGNPGPNSADSKQGARRGWDRILDKPGQPWGQKKGLLGMPWRVAFALQDDGWILRNSIIWHKPNAMPESVTDRLSARHENLFMFAKSQRYWFDLDPIREEAISGRAGRTWEERRSAGESIRAGMDQRAISGDSSMTPNMNGKNPGDVWSINTQPFSGAHFAVFPQELARRCIVAGCKPGGTVLDPFSGSGTTGLVAQRQGRKYIGVDISAEYLKLSLETRLQQTALDF